MSTPATADILALEDRRFAAQIAGDRAALDELLSDDLQYTHSNARVDTKTSYIDSITSGAVIYREARRTETEVHVTEGAAVVTGRAELDITAGGADRTITARYTAVWADVGGRWQFVAWQSTPYPG